MQRLPDHAGFNGLAQADFIGEQEAPLRAADDAVGGENLVWQDFGAGVGELPALVASEEARRQQLQRRLGGKGNGSRRVLAMKAVYAKVSRSRQPSSNGAASAKARPAVSWMAGRMMGFPQGSTGLIHELFSHFSQSPPRLGSCQQRRPCCPCERMTGRPAEV